MQLHEAVLQYSGALGCMQNVLAKSALRAFCEKAFLHQGGQMRYKKHQDFVGGGFIGLKYQRKFFPVYFLSTIALHYAYYKCILQGVIV